MQKNMIEIEQDTRQLTNLKKILFFCILCDLLIKLFIAFIIFSLFIGFLYFSYQKLYT